MQTCDESGHVYAIQTNLNTGPLSNLFTSLLFTSGVLSSLLSLQGGEVKTIVSGEGDPRLLALSNNENVADTGGNVLSVGVLHVNDIEASQMSLSVGDDTDSSNVVTTSNEGDVSGLELAVVNNLVVSQVDLDGVVDVNIGVGESDGSGVVGDDVGDLVGSDLFSLDLAELEASLILLQKLEGETTSDVVEDSVALVGLVEGEDVHKSDGELSISSESVVNSDISLLSVADGDAFSAGEGEFKTVSEDDTDGDGLSKSVGTLRGSLSEGSTELGEHPCLGGGDSLEMFLGSSGHE